MVDKSIFKPNSVYHVFNHGNADDNIFKEDENYHYFLKRYAHYIYPVAKTYAFCLLPNHFHFALKIRSGETLVEYFKSVGKDLEGFENLPGLLSKQFSNFLNSYAKSYNNRYDRKGRLFIKNLNRKLISNPKYYIYLITYIHQNPIKHGFVKHSSEWPFSSWHIFGSEKVTQLERDEVLKWFGGYEKFLDFYQQNQEIRKEQFY